MIADYISTVAELMLQIPRTELQTILECLQGSYAMDSTIFVCGNGGSAATASHFVCDLNKWTIDLDKRRVRAIALTDNVPLITAWSNDYDYTEIFVEQLRNLNNWHDDGATVVAISGSGNSPNVVRAVEWAKEHCIKTVALTGFDGGKLAQIARYPLIVPSECMPQIEDAHLAICHSLAVNLGRRIAQQN